MMGAKNKLMKRRVVEIIRGYDIGREFDIMDLISDYKERWARQTPTTNSLGMIMGKKPISNYITRYRSSNSQAFRYTRIDWEDEEE